MKPEEWRPVVGFPMYRVSDLGRVMSLYGSPPQFLKPTLNTGGYPKVNVWRDGHPHPRQVHRLVIEAFRGERPEGLQTRHLNGNRLDCRLDNLVFGSAFENAADKTRHGTHQRTRCVRDHLFDENNTRVSQGRRWCRACDRIRQAESRQRRALRAAGARQDAVA